MNPRNHALVLGMHRSGTSAVAKIIEGLGAPVGPAEEQVAATIDNPTGYGEAASIMRFNDGVMAANGWTWASVPLSNVPVAWSREDVVSGRQVLSGLGGGGLCVKDPRISAMLPLWRSITADRIASVVVLRHPLEVVWSLMVRDSLTPSHAAALWVAYHERLLRSLDGLPHLVVGFDDLISDARASAHRIADFLVANDALSEASEKIVDRASCIVDESLVRRTSPSRLEFHPAVASAVSVYEGLQKDLDNSGGVLPTTISLEPETETLVADILETRRSGEADGRRSVHVASKGADPSISVIFVLRGDHDAAGETMGSISGQLARPVQVVAVGSADDLEAAAARWSDIASDGASGIVLDFVTCDGTVPEARNAGLARATGDLVAFIDEGDCWTEMHLRALSAPFSVDPNLGWCFSDFDVVDETGRLTIHGWLAASAVVHPRRSLADLVQSPAHVLAPASIIRRSALEEIGYFNRMLEGASVDELFVRMFQSGWRTIHSPDCFTRRRMWIGGGPEGRTSLDARLALVARYTSLVPSTPNADLSRLKGDLSARLAHLRLLDYSRALRSGNASRAAEIAATLEDAVQGSRRSVRQRLLIGMLKRPRVTVSVLRAIPWIPGPLRPRLSPALSLRGRPE